MRKTSDNQARRPNSAALDWHWLPVMAVVFWNLWELRDTLLPVHYTNDSALHEQMVRFATERLRSGHDPLTSWFPYLGLGSPQFMHYQSTPAILTGLLGLVTGPDAAFRWSLYLLWSFWPTAIYCSARVFGLSRVVAAMSAAVAPLLTSTLGIGYEQHAYVFAGYGVWTQLWASWALPFAWALSWRAVADKRFVAPAAALVALTAALHYETGYLAFLAIPIMPLLIVKDLRARLARAAALLVVALLASAWVWFPLLRYSRWAAINQALVNGPSASGYGARNTLRWLVTGQVLDHGHLPLITLLMATGLAVTIWRWRRTSVEETNAGRALAALLCAALVLSFGRTTFGSLAAVIPGSTDVFFRRFLMGTQLAAIYLAGIGGEAIARQMMRPATRLTRLRWMPVAAVTIAGVAYLAPAWGYLDSFDAQNSADIQLQLRAQSADAPQTDSVIAYINRHGGGRTYAGSSINWGAYFTIGLAPMYEYLDGANIDEVGYSLRTASLMSQPEYLFDTANSGDYAVFGIRYLVLPAQASAGAGAPPRGAILVVRDSLFRLFELPGNSYFRVADTVGSVATDRADVGSQTSGYLSSALPERGVYRTIGYAGARPAPSTAGHLPRPSGPAGSILSEGVDLPDGQASATVRLRRRAIVVLSASYDPGWSVTVDGHRAATQMVTPALVAVAVPPGVHRIAVRYQGFEGYLPLFALAAAGLLAAALWGRPRRGRLALSASVCQDQLSPIRSTKSETGQRSEREEHRRVRTDVS